MTRSVCVCSLFLSAVISVCCSGVAQTQPTDTEKSQQSDPLARPRKSHKQKMERAYRKWIDDEVRDIITPEEQAAFYKLSNDSERASFVEAFWKRRDPTPDTEENEYKEEHYRRIAYADEHFSAGMKGSKTDRGRVYIIHGPPDSVDSHPMGGPYQRTAEEGGGQTSTFPFEVWRYRNIDYIGQEVEIEFVDTCMCGAYHITMDPDEKDALAKVPNAGLKQNELFGLSTKAQRTFAPFGPQAKQFDVIERKATVLAPPPIKYKDLQAVVDVKLRFNVLPFDVRTDFVKAGVDSTLVPITIQVPNSALTYAGKDGVQHASVNIFGRISTLSGEVMKTFEDSLRLDVPAELLPSFTNNFSLYQQALAMRPGRYKLDLVLKDVTGDKLGTIYQSFLVPNFDEEKLNTSSLILADQLEPVSEHDIGTGPFVFGPDKVRPRVPPANGDPTVFKQGEKIHLWMQVYNLSANKGSGTSSVNVEYHVVNTATRRLVYDHEITDPPADRNGITLKETLSQGKLPPGNYELTVNVNDMVSRETITRTAKFAVQQ